jgi:uncharacterized protein (UPF0332 family)
LTFSKHSAVISAFGREFAKSGTIDAEYHRYLTDAQDARNTGDYQVISYLTTEDAAQHISHAEKLLAAGATLLTSQSG